MSVTLNQAACIPHVVLRHAQESAAVFIARSAAAKSPPVKMWQLHRLDERLAAHLDGLDVAGVQAWPFLEEVFAASTAGAAFVVAVRAIAGADQDWLDRLFSAARERPDVYRELIGALGWIDLSHLQGLITRLLQSADPLTRASGLATCAMHRVDPGLTTGPWLQDSSPLVRARALRAAGEIGVGAMIPACVGALEDLDPECRLWAAWSAVLLGERDRALPTLWDVAIAPGRRRDRAFRLALQTMDLPDAHSVLRSLASDPQQLRRVIHGSGIVGDVTYVPWLIGHMVDDTVARVAGEAFSLITGADLVAHRLHRAAPDTASTELDDTPEDQAPAVDPDEGQPWPDPARVESWWASRVDRFPAGVRTFAGAPVTPERCIEILKSGCQYHRLAAARYLSLRMAGTALFNTSAPAKRQEALLAPVERHA